MSEIRPFYASWPAWAQAVAVYVQHLFIAVDQVFTALFGGWPDETVSSYLWRLDVQGKVAGRLLRPAVDAVWLAVFRERHHCRRASENERLRYQLPPELRGVDLTE